MDQPSAHPGGPCAFGPRCDKSIVLCGWVGGDKKQSASLVISSYLQCTWFGVYGRMPRSRFRLLQLTPRALLPDQGSLLRACSSRFKFSQGRSLSSAARPCLLFPQRVSQRRASNFRPQTGPGQSKHSVQASRKCNFSTMLMPAGARSERMDISANYHKAKMNSLIRYAFI